MGHDPTDELPRRSPATKNNSSRLENRRTAELLSALVQAAAAMGTARDADGVYDAVGDALRSLSIQTTVMRWVLLRKPYTVSVLQLAITAVTR